MPATRDAMINSHFRRLRNSAGVAVVYRRAAIGMECPLTAIKARSEYSITDNDGFERQLQVEDYICEAEAIVHDGAVITPREGDRIAEIDSEGEDLIVLEVQQPGDSEPCWKFADPARRWRRIHTKVITPEVLTP